MRQITRLGVLAAMLAVAATGCAVIQSKDVKHMLIDKFSTHIWNGQVLLNADQHAKFQAEFVGKLEKLLHGKYVITAKHIYLLPPDHRTVPNPVISRMDFNNMMMNVDPGEPELVFANETIDWPYVNVWKTSGSHPEFVAFSLYRNSDSNTLLGYFELAPTK